MRIDDSGMIHFEEGDPAQDRFAQLGAAVRQMADQLGVPANERTCTMINLAAFYLGDEVEDVAVRERLADEFVKVFRAKLLQTAREKAAPVDRSARTLTDGSPVTADHREINPATGQQKGYVVLSAEERAKGFVRPVRRTYLHKPCGTTTTMGVALAETYARDPKFYSGTFCVACRTHFPLDQFVWEGTDEMLGS